MEVEKKPRVAPHVAELPKSGIRKFFDIVAQSKDITFCDTVVTVKGAMTAETEAALGKLADELLAQG